MAQSQSTQQDLLVAGDSAYAVFDNQKALAYYEQAFAEDSTDFDTRIRLSRTSYDFGLDQVAAGDDDVALPTFERSILHARALVTHFPDSAQSHFLLAATMGNLALFKNGREKLLLGRLVAEHSKKAIALDSTLAYPYVSLGIYYRELSSLSWIEKTLAKVFFGRIPEATSEQALELLQTALRLRPDFPFLHFELAMTFKMLNQFDKAIEHLETLIALQPESSQDARNQSNAKKLITELKVYSR
ncbi:MAG: tetratricopeptide repeat protein [Rhodothermales bacterium]